MHHNRRHTIFTLVSLGGLADDQSERHKKPETPQRSTHKAHPTRALREAANAPPFRICSSTWTNTSSATASRRVNYSTSTATALLPTGNQNRRIGAVFAPRGRHSSRPLKTSSATASRRVNDSTSTATALLPTGNQHRRIGAVFAPRGRHSSRPLKTSSATASRRVNSSFPSAYSSGKSTDSTSTAAASAASHHLVVRRSVVGVQGQHGVQRVFLLERSSVFLPGAICEDHNTLVMHHTLNALQQLPNKSNAGHEVVSGNTTPGKCIALTTGSCEPVRTASALSPSGCTSPPSRVANLRHVCHNRLD